MAMTKPLSEQVRFTQDGTGAVERLASEKLKEWVSVKDFGAVGDGLTDDTSAIQAAINSAAANPMIFVPPGSYLVGGLTISQPLTLFGAGWNASKFVAKSGIGDSNMLYASGVSGIVVSGLGFNMRNDEIAGTRATAYIENIACFISCKNVVIRRCCFQKAINHNVIFNAASGAESENIEVADCHFENGARGAVLSARYGKNFHVKNNTMLNVCNQTLSGIDFDKSISLSGVINAIISGNSVSQTIPGGGTIIVEYTDRPSENITISNNAVIGQAANGIKVGASNNVKIYGNTCIDSTSTGIYLEGVYDCSVSNNFVDRSAVNGLRAYEDFQTSRANKNLIIQGNIFKNSNTEGASIGVPNVSQGVAEAYHIAIRQSEHINILDNVFIDDSTSSASGIWMQGQKYTIERNNFLQMKPAAVTLYNTATTVGSEYFIKDNRGMQTTDEGRATIASGSVSVAVSPAVVAESTNARISLSPNTALNGTVAYLFAATSGTGVFAIYARNASHDTPTVSASIDVTWEYSVTDAIGIFGKTSK